jgi:hypothetical protein
MENTFTSFRLGVGVDVAHRDGRRRLAGQGEEKLDVTRVVNVRRRVRIAAAQPLVKR